MYAIIRTGSKQYRVKQGDVIDVELLEGEPSSEVIFNEVLMLTAGSHVKVGTPAVAGAAVKALLLGTVRDEKLVVFKYKRRKNCRTKKGHRQKLSKVQITEIVGGN